MTESDRTSLEVVGLFASALDGDDFEVVRSMLHPDVTYRIDVVEHRGPDAVVRSYSEGSARARALFDRVEFDHTVVGLVGDRTVRVDFSDRLEVAGDSFVHHSVQDIEVGRDSTVVAIVDQPVAGQREQIDAFMRHHGLRRPNSASPAS